MTCPICGGATKVTNSRRDCEGVYRIRKCVDCNHTFTTAEYESDREGIRSVWRENNKKYYGRYS